MKFIIYLSTLFCLVSSSIIAAEPPEILGQYLEPNKLAKGEVVLVSIPAEFLKFRDLMAQAEKADPKWFKKQMEKIHKENPIPPYDAKLGITKTEYDKYVAAWDQRSYKRIENGEVQLMLTEDSDGNWVINVSGKGMPLSLLKYVTEKDQFESSNGTLKRIEDIKTPKESIYRDWNGHEWKYFNDGDIFKIKENVAIGRSGDGRYGILIYSLQELASDGKPLADDLIMIRFVPKKLKN